MPETCHHTNDRDSWRAILIRFHIKYQIIVEERKREERFSTLKSLDKFSDESTMKKLHYTFITNITRLLRVE